MNDKRQQIARSNVDTPQQRTTQPSSQGQRSMMRPTASTPFSLMRRMIEDMDRMFDDFGIFGRSPDAPLGQLGPIVSAPQIEVSEQGGKLCVKADLPGVEPNDVQVHVDGDVLVIEGERREERESNEQEQGFYHSERSYGAFMRRVALPRGVDASTCDASFHNGVLKITLDLPKESRKRIDVKSHASQQQQPPGKQPTSQTTQQTRPTEEGQNGTVPSARH